MKYKLVTIEIFILFISFIPIPIFANHNIYKKQQFNVHELILDHTRDSYNWHIVSLGNKQISIPLPIIVKGQTSGWYVFSSARLYQGDKSYKGFSIAQTGEYKDKIVETLSSGIKVRPLDFSLTKNAVSLIMSSTTLIILILICSC